MGNKETKTKKKTGVKKTGTKKAGVPKETGKKSGSVKTAGKAKEGQPPVKKKASVQKTKLRLIKNGDLPVEDKVKKVSKQAPVQKKNDFYRDKSAFGDWFLQHRSLFMIGTTIFIVLSLITAGYIYFIKTYTVTTVYVDGNVHYTNEEVMEMVMTGYYGNNSLLLSLKYQNKGVEGVPFVEKMDVNILSPNTIRINVYEKALAGYVEYLGRYMYFDKDGIIVESSNKRTSGVPQVTGLKFNYVVMHEPLPVESEDIFKRVLNITQLLSKYTLAADKIFFDSAYDLTLFFEDIKVTLGSSEYIDEKIMRLKSILPKLDGKKGTLRLESFEEDTKNISFIEE